MIAALFALAAAMLITGVIAVVEGFPYVRLESGMAMVYGGAVVASSGILLFGLAVVATWLRRIEATLRDDRSRDERAPAEVASAPASEPAFDLSAAALTIPAAAPSPDRPRIEPSLGVPSRVLPAEPELPMAGLIAPIVHPPEKKPAAESARPAEPVAEATDDLFVPGRLDAATPEPAPETILRSSLDEAPEANAEPKVSERTVVGRYSSGGNTYMMYDNGAIEADTPNGRFTFASLDELKAFVDGGGEAGARGAA